MPRKDLTPSFAVSIRSKIKRTARAQRWTDARRVISAGLEILSHEEDRYLRARFNQIVDRVNKQIAAGLTDPEIVLDALSRGAKDLDRLKAQTLLSGPDLAEILENLETQGRIRRISRSTVELRDKPRERGAVLRAMRSRPGSTTLEDLREETGFSRRHVSQIMAELQDDKKVVRTRSGFVLKAIAQAARSLEHEDECLCRTCLTPRHLLAAAGSTQTAIGGF